MYEPTDQPAQVEDNQAIEDSSVDDKQQVWSQYPSEVDHPFKSRDPRNQYVQNNNRFVEVENQPKEYDFNHVKPYFKTTYKSGYSPPKKVADRK